jgi:hypothetical protein
MLLGGPTAGGEALTYICCLPLVPQVELWDAFMLQSSLDIFITVQKRHGPSIVSASKLRSGLVMSSSLI